MTAATRSARRLVLAAALALAVVVPVLLALAGRSRYWHYIAAEDTPMTWLQSVVLVVTCVLALVVAHVVRLAHHRAVPWLVLAAGFGYLALDERFAVHERLRDRVLAPHGVRVPFLPWMGPGDFVMLVVALVGLAVLPMVLRALAADRLSRAVLLVGVVVAACAVGMDSLDPARMSLATERLEQTLEECLELAAGLCFASAVATRLLSAVDEVLGGGRSVAEHVPGGLPGASSDTARVDTAPALG